MNNIQEKVLSDIKIILNKNWKKTQKLKEICKILKDNFEHFDWVGFYLAVPDKKELHLGPFVGEPTDHKIIAYGQGICGQAAMTQKTFIVPDVSKESNYLACSVKVRSEIVVPIIKENQFVGELDIDSHQINAFSESVQQFLELISSLIAELLVPEKEVLMERKTDEKVLQKYKIMSEQAAQAPNSASLQERLGDLCLELGYREEALFRYKKAVELGAEKVLDKIKENFKEVKLEDIAVGKQLPFNELIEEAIKYPFIKKGYLTVFVGALVFAFLSVIPLVGGLLLYFVGYPYLLAYMFKILQSTEAGRNVLPEWPEFTDWWESIYRPFFLFDAASLSASIPLIIFFLIFVLFPGALSVVLILIGILIFGLYFPIALISAAINENFFSPFNYPLLIKSIIKIWRSYFITVVVLLVAVFVDWLITVFLVPFSIPFIGPLVFWIISIYFLVVEMRLLGSVYYQNKNLLNW